jgi:hypothetical protein
MRLRSRAACQPSIMYLCHSLPRIFGDCNVIRTFSSFFKAHLLRRHVGETELFHKQIYKLETKVWTWHRASSGRGVRDDRAMQLSHGGVAKLGIDGCAQVY